VTDTLPDNTGYVAAAYLVFFALLLIYLAIMAIRVARLEAALTELVDRVDERPPKAEPAEEVIR
jgi:hypothetical protein